MTVDTISPQALKTTLDAGGSIDLIDVRTPIEYREIHAEVGRNIPLDELDPRALMESRNGTSGDPLYVICRTGNRADKACRLLDDAGFSNVVNVEGGIVGWEQSGLPVVHGKKAISLERQVRIVAGLLVLIGAVLALSVHVWFSLLPAFVGAGLAFAGITDTCGMGMLLAKMPWNRVERECQTSCNQ